MLKEYSSTCTFGQELSVLSCEGSPEEQKHQEVCRKTGRLLCNQLILHAKLQPQLFSHIHALIGLLSGSNQPIRVEVWKGEL